MTEREAVNAIAEYVQRNEYSFQEYSDMIEAFDDDVNTFVIGWDNERVTYIRIQNCAIAPPDEIKWLKNIFLADVEQTAGDLSWLGTLKQLRYLYLVVWREEFPESLADISSLESITLRYPANGKVSKIPPKIRRCKKLQKITLHNALGPYIELPDWIYQLPNLKYLDLCNCWIKAIPYSLVQTGLEFVLENSSKREGIHLFGTRLEEGDLGLFGQSREVIERYYSGKQENTRECKVIFLGDGAAGKSSLIDRIIKDEFKEDSPATDGIRTCHWNTTVNGEDLELRILDFGGQEIMHAMHRCFLTAHTVYVVVCEIRNDSDIDREAIRWLENVKAFAPNCPVILALNKADQNNNVSVNERSLREINPELRCVLKTSAKWPREKGTFGLIEAILREVPGCISNFTANADMLGIKWDLEHMGKDYISEEEYQEICNRNRIKETDLQRGMLNWFKDLGVAYFYSSNELNTHLENVRVLNPAWLTNGIYRLILRTPSGGFLSHQTIKETLRATDNKDVMPDKVYTPQETEFILYVMRNFEISLNMQNGMEMIPMKMDKTPPDTIDSFVKDEALHLRWIGSYIPNNVMHRLMIRKSRELDRDCLWRTGACFGRDGSSALAEMSETSLDIYVTAVHDSRQYMEEFRVLVRQILSEMNISCQEVICCRIDGQEGQVSYEDVLQQYHDKMEKIYIPGIRKYISPFELLKESYLEPEKEIERYIRIDTLNAIHTDQFAISTGSGDAVNQFRKSQEVKELAQAIQNTKAVELQTIEDIRNAMELISKNKNLSFWQRQKIKTLVKKIGKKSETGGWEKIRDYLGDAANLATLIPVIEQCAPRLLDIFQKIFLGI